jgi:putative FmdB family regulatory protein
MPTYEYACRLCGHQFEIFQSMKDDPMSECPSCGENGLKRLIGLGAGIIFKGSGFYETDYKREGSKKASEPEGGEAAKSDTSTTSGSDGAKLASGTSSSGSKSDT